MHPSYYLIFTRDAFQANTNGGAEDYDSFLLFPKHTVAKSKKERKADPQCPARKLWLDPAAISLMKTLLKNPTDSSQTDWVLPYDLQWLSVILRVCMQAHSLATSTKLLTPTE